MSAEIISTETIQVLSKVSRRRCVTLLAAAAAARVLMPSSAVAQKHQYEFDADKLVWRTYRRNDFGFSVEIPGEPLEGTDENAGMKQTDIEVMFDRTSFKVLVYEFPNIVGADKVEWVARGQETFWGLKPQTKWLTLGNARVREDIFTNKDMITVNHIVAHGRCVLQQAYDGVVSDTGVKAAGERFMASLKLF